MKKRFLALVLALIMCLSLLPGTAVLADSEKIGDFYIEGTTLYSYVGPGGDVVIPDNITTINQYAFRNSAITSVVIPDNVTSCGGGVFENCKSLRSAVIGDGLTEVSVGMFSGCSSLESVTIGENVKKIGTSAFANCTSLKSVSMGDKVEIIDTYAFQNCSSLSDINVPRSLREIGNLTFGKCTSLTSYNIPESVKTTQLTFQGCSSLEDTVVPSYAVFSDIGYYWGPFELKGGLLSGFTGTFSHVVVPDGVTKVSSLRSTNVVSVKLPDSVTSIGYMAFMGDAKLEEINIPEGVTDIDTCAFSDCSSLKSLVLPDSLKSVGQAVINRCSSLTHLTVGGSGMPVIKTDFSGAALTDVTIRDGVTTIAQQAFNYYHGLKTVHIPTSVTSIEKRAFYDCKSLEIYYAGSRAQFEKINMAMDAFYPGTVVHCSDDEQGANEIRVYFYGGFSSDFEMDPNRQPKISFESKNVIYNKPYGELPTWVAPYYHEDMIFDGWYTEPNGKGGTLVTESTPVANKGNHALYAHYHSSKEGHQLTVKFYIAGNVKNPDDKTVICGQPYGALPTPTREGYTFLGWYDEPTNGAKITETSTVVRKVSHTLYARWAGDNQNQNNNQNNYSSSQQEAQNKWNRVINNKEYSQHFYDLNMEFLAKGVDPKYYEYTIVTDDVQAKSDEICAGLTTDLEKVTAIHAWVTDHIYYDYEALYSGSYPPRPAQYILDRRAGVCSGYAILTQALCCAQGIPAVYVCGGTTNGYHAWNLVKLDGEWKWIDSTWDTYNAYYGRNSWQDGSRRNDYFLCPTEFISKDHWVNINSRTDGPFAINGINANLPSQSAQVVQQLIKQEEERLKSDEYLKEIKKAVETDGSMSAWAKSEIDEAAELGLVPGDIMNNFTNKITREEFCALMVKLVETQTGKDIASYITSKGKTMSAPFTDTSTQEVKAAYALGIVNGVSATKFNPSGSITRQEAAAMLERTAKVLGMSSGAGVNFSDSGKIASWATGSVAFVSGLTDPYNGNKVMGGVGKNSFDPLGTYTREQAIATSLRLFHCAA